ncbi:DUF2846 domain-containing protein [Caulobacter sp. KR2-114]|uniref:DUF2846 domain-containing protein n=1 Tax=Caulobacter sp. KR2-114 TaxID=3400912 RepID=UPI003C048BAF
MNKYIRPIVIGFVVAFVVGFGVSALFNALHIPSPGLSLYFAIFFGGFTAYILANLAGNRKVATADAGQQAQALTMTAPADKALVYVYRQGFVGMAAGLNVSVDGRTVAQLTSPRFTVVSVAPGAHTLTAGFGGLAGAQNKVASEPFTAEAGGVYAFRLTLSMGMLQNSIQIAPMPDLAPVKAALGGMKMTAPEISEI